MIHAGDLVKTELNIFHRGGFWQVKWVDLMSLKAGLVRPDKAQVVEVYLNDIVAV